MIKRLGIFGGAFAPVHKGHTQSLKYISDLKIIDEKGSVKRVWVSAKAIRSGLVKKA